MELGSQAVIVQSEGAPGQPATTAPPQGEAASASAFLRRVLELNDSVKQREKDIHSLQLQHETHGRERKQQAEKEELVNGCGKCQQGDVPQAHHGTGEHSPGNLGCIDGRGRSDDNQLGTPL